MSTVFSIIEKVAATSSKNEKLAILEDVKGGDEKTERLLKQIIEYAYSPFYTYDIIKFNDKPGHHSSAITIEDTFDVLEALNAREITGNEAIALVEQVIARLTPDDAELFTRIVRRDLRCGASAGSFNKVWPGVVYSSPYMRCSSFSLKNLKKIKMPCTSELKMDGMYIDIIVNPDSVAYRSRTGHKQPLSTHERDTFLMQHAKNDGGFVLMGEAVVTDGHGKYLPREVGNGYLQSGDVDPTLVEFVVWDCVPLKDYLNEKSKAPRSIRIDRMKFICASDRTTLKTPSFTPVESRVCNTVADIIEHFKDAVLRGEEGTVVKNIDAAWKDGTSTECVKMKIVAEGELLVTGVIEGEGRLKGMCGALSCMSSCGLVKVNVAGLSDALRKKFFQHPETIVGQIITVLYNDVVYSKSTQCWSLFLPRYVEIRLDKTVADDKDRLVEQLDAAIEAIALQFM